MCNISPIMIPRTLSALALPVVLHSNMQLEHYLSKVVNVLVEGCVGV